MCDNICFERYELKMCLLNIIDEKPDDPYVPVNSSSRGSRQKTGSSA